MISEQVSLLHNFVLRKEFGKFRIVIVIRAMSGTKLFQSGSVGEWAVLETISES